MSESSTFTVEFSYEATTMDYMTPKWYQLGEPFASKEEAEAVKSAKQQEHYESGVMCAWRVKENKPVVYMGGDDVDAMWSQRYWSDKAAHYDAVNKAHEEMLETFAKGKVVKVVKGRKVPVGTEGTVFWLGEDKYSRTGAYRIGFETVMGEKHFTALSNVEAIPGMVEVGA